MEKNSEVLDKITIDENWYCAEENECTDPAVMAEVEHFIQNEAEAIALELEQFPERGLTIEQVETSMKLYHLNALHKSRHAA